MKHFLSGFSDADAEVILKHCREVLTSDGKILLLQVRMLGLTVVLFRQSSQDVSQSWIVLKPCTCQRDRCDAMAVSCERGHLRSDLQLVLHADDCA